MERNEVNLLDYFTQLYRARKFILLNFVAVTVLAGVFSFFLPVFYLSSTTIMPPQESNEAFGFGSVLSSMPLTRLTLGGRGTPADLAVGVLESGTVAITIIDKFNLVDVYGVENRDQAQMVLKGLKEVSLTKEGLIKVEVEDQDPVRSAEIANMYIATLDSLQQYMGRRSAKERADFIEQQIHENTNALTRAEIELKEFQLRNKAISPIHQQRVALSVSAELELDLMKKENQLKEYRSKSFSDTHPLIRGLLNQIRFGEEMLHDMRFGSPDERRETLFVPLQEAPDLTLEYTRLARRVEVLGMLEQLLRQHYEESRIEQVNTTSTVTVLDRARPPQVKNRPKRKLIVMVAGAGSIFFSIVSILLFGYFTSLTELTEDNRRKVDRLARYLRVKS